MGVLDITPDKILTVRDEYDVEVSFFRPENFLKDPDKDIRLSTYSDLLNLPIECIWNNSKERYHKMLKILKQHLKPNILCKVVKKSDRCRVEEYRNQWNTVYMHITFVDKFAPTSEEVVGTAILRLEKKRKYHVWKLKDK